MKKLEIIKNPSSNCYQYMAFPLMILEQHSKSFEWIYENFVQTYFDLRHLKVRVPYYYYIFDYTISPFLHVHKVNRTFLEFNKLNIIEFIKNSVNNGYYIYLNLDEFYVPNRFSYAKNNFLHDCLIYGYDLSRREIYLYGFSTSNHLDSTVITFEEFKMAYENIELNEERYIHINLYKYKDLGEYRLNLEILVQQLIDYVEGVNISKNFIMLKNEPIERVYGMKFYQHIDKYLLVCENSKVKYDIRIFHFIYEHKQMMKNRIKYLLETSRIIDMTLLENWEDITAKALILRNVVMKLNILCEYNFQKLSEYIQILGESERAILNKTIWHLEAMLSKTL
ncbi:MAG: hypothetical protein FWE25_02985 [Lachnospiraceae bacterium]|nr:hypothetical protein [Lachnospiraceae bacterium]